MISTLPTGLKRISISLLLCLLCWGTYGQSHFKLEDYRKRVSLPFNFVRNLIVVRLKINDKGPFNFVLDSGVGLMIVTDPKLVDSLNIKNKRSILVTGMGEGKDFEAYVVPSIKVDLPGISGESIPAAILKKDEFGLSNYAGMPISGLLGYEFFSSFAVKINFSDSTLVVGKLKDLRVFKHCDKVPISVEENKPYITTKVKIAGDGNTNDNKLILDLGAGHPLSIENLVSQNNGVPAKMIPSNLGISLTGPIKGFLSRIEQFEIGKYKLKNVIVSFPTVDTAKSTLLTVKRDGNIGMQVLKKFNLIIDYESGWLYLKPNYYFNDPFEQDMSGIEYYSTGSDLKHIVISNVESGSGAEEVGLKKGYEILSINFKDVSKMDMAEIDKIFSSRDGRALLIEIFHDNKYDKVILVLKRRV